MSSELSQMILANGFDLKQNIKDQRNADSNEQLAQVLKQSQINQRDAQADYYNKQSRGQNLQNTQLAREMARGPQNTFQQVKGNDNNLYNVEYNSQGNVVNSTLIPGMGNAPKKPLTALQEKLSLATGIDFRDMTQEQKTEAYKLVTDPKAPTKLQEIQLSNAQLANDAARAKVGAATTGKEADSRNFYTMMQEATANLDNLTKKTLNKQTGLMEDGYNPANALDTFTNELFLGNAISDEKKQLANQSQRQWTRAKLRLESGAAIGEQEMLDEISTFFPEFGESEAVIKQKKRMREAAEKSMFMGTGVGFDPPPISSEVPPKDIFEDADKILNGAN